MGLRPAIGKERTENNAAKNNAIFSESLLSFRKEGIMLSDMKKNDNKNIGGRNVKSNSRNTQENWIECFCSLTKMHGKAEYNPTASGEHIWITDKNQVRVRGLDDSRDIF